ncbi:glycosyltransferase family 4 protein [Micromonospora echinofusca]|uniref:Glycosyltransferase n=1 Tax=Micromonospora echinofusca TaxID=47858 RepID=A0ABS3VVL8_MICEH|nr:glycosyltransferase family 4 protein [Micromonospora echinofusca]MBO4208569.1 glycosyltransferase [Micromonospora echinofusca]
MTGAEPIRVAMLHGPGRPEHDGVSDYVARLIDALGGVDVDAVGVPVRPTGPPVPGRWWRATGRAARQVRRLRPDLVHVQFAPSAYRFSGAPGLLPFRLPGAVPLVTTVHEYGWWAVPRWLPDPVWSVLERSRRWDRETGRLVPASAAVVATNPEHGRAVRQRLGVPVTRVPIAPNVDVRHTGPDSRQRTRADLGLPPEAPVLVFFGFVHPVKGVRQLIEALPALRAGHGDLRLLVVGGFTSQALPPSEARAFHAELAGLTRRHAVEGVVHFTGHLPAERVSAALHAADVAVLPFTAGVTTKSGALLTMLAHGLPTAVTEPDGGDPELRDNGAVALIPARRDPAAIVRTVDRLLHDPGLRARLAERGHRFARERSWPQVAASHRRIYEQVLGRGR